MAGGRLVDPDLELIREVKKAGGETLNKCYQCSTCTVVCNLSPADNPFPRKEMLYAQWGQTDKLIADPDVWLCHQCSDCTIHCPRGARPGDALAAVRSYIYKYYSFPRFMGKALANPKALPILLLVPVLILLAAVIFLPKLGPDGEILYLTSSTIDFDYLLQHSFVDALFVAGNILIFCFAGIGFYRFWKRLNAGGEKKTMSFLSALIKTKIEIFAHTRFNQCVVNKPRALAHMLLFYGFIGAMITTGSVFILIFVPHYLDLLGLQDWQSLFELPLALPNPIKILGAVSGVAMVVGGAMLIYRRWTNRDQVGANGYSDYLFLYMLFFAGLTGMFAWLTRLTGVPMLAYVNYFLHIVAVFFLLWYMPYSKFAHMIYRALALTYARQIGREPRK